MIRTTFSESEFLFAESELFFELMISNSDSKNKFLINIKYTTWKTKKQKRYFKHII